MRRLSSILGSGDRTGGLLQGGVEGAVARGLLPTPAGTWCGPGEAHPPGRPREGPFPQIPRNRDSPLPHLQAPARRTAPPSVHFVDIGFRCGALGLFWVPPLFFVSLKLYLGRSFFTHWTLKKEFPTPLKSECEQVDTDFKLDI